MECVSRGGTVSVYEQEKQIMGLMAATFIQGWNILP